MSSRGKSRKEKSNSNSNSNRNRLIFISVSEQVGGQGVPYPGTSPIFLIQQSQSSSPKERNRQCMEFERRGVVCLVVFAFFFFLSCFHFVKYLISQMRRACDEHTHTEDQKVSNIDLLGDGKKLPTTSTPPLTKALIMLLLIKTKARFCRPGCAGWLRQSPLVPS